MKFDIITGAANPTETGATAVTRAKDGIHYDVHIYNPLTEEIEHHINVTASEAERLAPVHFQFVK